MPSEQEKGHSYINESPEEVERRVRRLLDTLYKDTVSDAGTTQTAQEPEENPPQSS